MQGNCYTTEPNLCTRKHSFRLIRGRIITLHECLRKIIKVYLEFSHVTYEYILKCTSKTELIYGHRFIKLHYQPEAYEDLEIRVFLHESETSMMVHICSIFVYGTRKITDLLQ